MQTAIAAGDPRAVKRWANTLAIDTERQLYWKKFLTDGDAGVIQKMVDLQEDAGDTITFDLNMRLREEGISGDERAAGKGEALQFYTDDVRIDQFRKPVSTGGKMTKQRTIHNLRKLAKDRGSEYLAEWQDDMITTYLSGDATFSSINQGNKFLRPFAGNPVTAPDARHLLYGGVATSKASLTIADKMTASLIERISVAPEMMNEENADAVRMSPVSIDGDKYFCLVMSKYQAYDMRVETGDLSWSKIAQAAATSEGRNSPIFKGGLGKINNVILHEHTGVKRFSDYGAGQNVAASRALLLGRQAGVLAYGKGSNGSRMLWEEETSDFKNQLEIACGAVLGFTKATYNGFDFGVIAIDTAARNPN